MSGVIHYDKELSGHIACGYSRYDYAHEDIRKVTCRKCLKRANKSVQATKARLRFLTNTHDPKDKLAPMFVARRFDETQEEAWAHHVEWLKDKVIGEPEATEAYTVEQLKGMGLVGVYA